MTKKEAKNETKFPIVQPGWQLVIEGEEFKLVSKKTLNEIGINGTSATVFSLINDEKSVFDIIEELSGAYPDAADAIAVDTLDIMKVFAEQNIIVLSDAPKSAAYPQATPRHDKAKLCIGMATYDDYDGVYFSIQSLRLFHPEILDQVEFIVIDNNPAGRCSASLKKLDSTIERYRYIPNGKITGTAVRDYVFAEANADYVMCMDSHVLVDAGAIAKLIKYFDDNPDSMDLLQGPLLNDGFKFVSTHFRPKWSAGMYGTWGTDARGTKKDGEPFEIQMQGLGLFACRKEAWLGFNENFSGFGGEEGYIHEKFRQAGNKTICLPFLRWLHRFDRPLGPPNEVTWHDRVRNYAIGHHELGLDTSEMKEHFIELLGEHEMKKIMSKLEPELGTF